MEESTAIDDVRSKMDQLMIKAMQEPIISDLEQLAENVENLKPLLEDVRVCSEATEVVELIDKWRGDPGAYVRQKVPFDRHSSYCEFAF